MDKLAVSQDLINALWEWYAPYDTHRSKQSKAPSARIRCHSLKSCKISNEAYQESFNALRTLKTMRRIAHVLMVNLDANIKELESSVLPPARAQGIYSLPSEVLINIMTLVCGSCENNVESLKGKMWMFLEVAPFKSHVPMATQLIREWRETEKTWTGGFPDGWNFSKLYLTRLEQQTTISNVVSNLQHHRHLQHLAITYNIAMPNLVASPSDHVFLPSLVSLFIGGIWGSRQGIILATETFGKLLKKLQMPKLANVKVAIAYPSYSKTYENDDTSQLNSIFDFPTQTYPTVSSFELRWNSQIYLRDMLKSMPALQHLYLSGDGYSTFAIADSIDEEEDEDPVVEIDPVAVQGESDGVQRTALSRQKLARLRTLHLDFGAYGYSTTTLLDELWRYSYSVPRVITLGITDPNTKRVLDNKGVVEYVTDQPIDSGKWRLYDVFT